MGYNIIICQNWLDGALLKHYDVKNKRSPLIITTALGNLSEEQVILICRSFQLLMGMLNVPFAMNRVAYRSAGMMMIFVVSSFALIKYGSTLFLGGSLMAMLLTLMLGTAMIVLVFIFYVSLLFVFISLCLILV